MTKANPERRHFGRGADGLRRARPFFAATRSQRKEDSTTRSVRLASAAWELLDARAALGISARALAIRTFAEWLYTSSQVPPRAAAKRAT